MIRVLRAIAGPNRSVSRRAAGAVGGLLAFLVAFTPAAAQTVVRLGGLVSSQPVGIAVDDAGDVLYDTLFFSDGSVSTDVKVLLAAKGSVPPDSPTQIAIGSGFSFPHGLAVDPATLDVFVADLDNNAVKQIVFADKSIRVLGSGFVQPSALALDRRGNVFVIDNGGDSIKEIVAVGGAVPDNPTIRTLAKVDPKNPTPAFVGPATGIEVDAAGDVYWFDVPSPGNPTNTLKRFSAVAGVVPDNPVPEVVASGFYRPTDAAIDHYNNVVVCDMDHNEIDLVVAVNGLIPPNPQIKALGSGFQHPTSVAFDTDGNVYVADGDNQAIKEILPSDTIFRDGLELPPRGFPAPTP